MHGCHHCHISELIYQSPLHAIFEKNFRFSSREAEFIKERKKKFSVKLMHLYPLNISDLSTKDQAASLFAKQTFPEMTQPRLAQKVKQREQFCRYKHHESASVSAIKVSPALNNFVLVDLLVVFPKKKKEEKLSYFCASNV